MVKQTNKQPINKNTNKLYPYQAYFFCTLLESKCDTSSELFRIRHCLWYGHYRGRCFQSVCPIVFRSPDQTGPLIGELLRLSLHLILKATGVCLVACISLSLSLSPWLLISSHDTTHVNYNVWSCFYVTGYCSQDDDDVRKMMDSAS